MPTPFPSSPATVQDQPVDRNLDDRRRVSLDRGEQRVMSGHGDILSRSCIVWSPDRRLGL
ncbi:MAG: hypothetical protein HC871_03045 [Rhizobiales bacterium]|nr:hypothetical protein [Hyphomicrobiales bacterium]